MNKKYENVKESQLWDFIDKKLLKNIYVYQALQYSRGMRQDTPSCELQGNPEKIWYFISFYLAKN